MNDIQKAEILRGLVKTTLNERNRKAKTRLRVYPSRVALLVPRKEINHLAGKHGVTGMELIIYAIRQYRFERDFEFVWRSPNGPMEIRIGSGL